MTTALLLPAIPLTRSMPLAGFLRIELKENTSVSGIKPLADGGDAYLFRNPNHADEYYLIENRQQKGWDAALAGSGIMINHIDYNLKAWNYNIPNSMMAGVNDHERMTFVPADNVKSEKSEEYDALALRQQEPPGKQHHSSLHIL